MPSHPACIEAKFTRLCAAVAFGSVLLGSETTICQETAPRPIVAKQSSDHLGDDFFDFDASERKTVDTSVRDDVPAAISIQLPDTLSTVEPFGSGTVSPELNGWVRWIVLKNIPPAYEDLKKWNLQKDVIRKIDWQREGWQWKPVTVYKKVNHGTWSRYFIELIDPANQLAIQIENLRQPRQGIVAFDVTVETPLKVFGRISQWQRDVQLISLSANAQANAKLNAHCEVEVIVNPLKIPPDVLFRPKVTDAHVELTNFRVSRISQIGGPMAKHLGTTLRELVEDKLEDFDDKLVEKMNRQLDKQQDKLTLSLQDWMQTQIQVWMGIQPPH